MGRPAAALVAALTLAHVVAALIFCRGFLLTRVELPDTSACPGPGCLTHPSSPPDHSGSSSSGGGGGDSHAAAYDRAVILIVDALRFDFVCEPATVQKPFAGAFPRTLALVGDAGGAATTLRFVADTPTITMSRLKALLTGGLPTFLDVGSSFSASQVTEDNLLSQLKAAGKRIAFVGDDTWQQLAPSALEWSWPYPSFNVKDLHTVDDGVWQHILPLLRGTSPDALANNDTSAATSSGADKGLGRAWDILIGHYLGVDHAGHSHGVGGAPMAAKLAQMDAQVSTVIGLMVDGAGPGGPYERTLLVILSDHGQTLGGDHGGGAPDETDSVLIATSPAKLRHVLLARQLNVQLQDRLDSLQTALLSDGWASGRGDGLLPGIDQSTALPPRTATTCGGTIPQIDLTPTLALLMGIPIPFGNLGKVPVPLWYVLSDSTAAAAAGQHAPVPGVAAGGGEQQEERQRLGGQEGYAAALAANAAQVHRYLNRYATVAKLPARALARCNQLFAAAAAATTEAGAQGDEVEAVVAAWTAFLEAAAALARAQFTRFDPVFIWAGVAAAAGAAGLHLWLCWRTFHSDAARHSKGSAASTWSWETWCLAGLEAAHALSLFSVGALMGEGRVACGLVDAATLLLTWSTLSAVNRTRGGYGSSSTPSRDANGAAGSVQQQQPLRKGSTAAVVVALAGALLATNHLLQRLGLIDRYGQDPHDKTEPSGELLGPSGGGSGLLAQHLAATAGAALGAWLLWAAAAARLRRWEANSCGGGKAMAVATQALAAVAQAAASVEAAAIAAFWWAQLTGRGNMMAGDAVQSAWTAVAAQAPPLVTLASLLPVNVLAVLAPLGALPLRLLLPRIVYTLALLTLASALLLGVARAAVWCAASSSSVTPPAAPRAALWVLAAASGPVAMALGYKGPATVALGWAQAIGVVGMLTTRTTARRATATTAAAAAAAAKAKASSQAKKSPQDSDRAAVGLPAAVEDDAAPLTALLLGMQALQLFFCSGHFCEFSGLQYASSFIGFDEMVPAVSGPLLLVNTLGPMMVLCLGLPIAVSVTTAALEAAPVAGASRATGRGQESSPEAVARRMTGALLLLGGVRAAALAVCIASAAVQQGHVLLWAIFAPKLVFEMWMCAVADLFLLLAAIMWPG